MKRLLLTLFLALSAAFPALADSLPVSLKPQAVIEGDTVKLGDLWDNLGPKANVVIANAPQPGKRITADARWLLAVAQNNGIDWQPASAFDRIVIERAGQNVDVSAIEDELKDALSRQGVPGPMELEIANRSALVIVVPAGTSTDVGIYDVAWDPRTSRFSATLEVPSGSPTAQRQRLTGRVFPITRVPVLSRALSKGDVVTHNDIEWLDVRAEAVRGDVATDPRQIIGQEPRRAVRPGYPVRLSELQRPVLVTRNSTVTMVLVTPFMNLAAQGRAMEDGGKGDVVRVTNMHTKRTVEAIVDGPGRVVVTQGSGVALAN